MTYSMIVAMDENHVIGLDQGMPWHLPNDLKYFKSVTSQSTIVMGRKTFESIGRPLPKRHNIILTRQKDFNPEGCTVIHSWEELQEVVSSNEHVFIIGGAALFAEALSFADYMYITHIHSTFEGDTYFPEVDWSKWELVERTEGETDEKNQHAHTFSVYKRQ
ncbi:dihydrofolate reductase [Alkalibacillus almallahensis]|uniref:dihydrofolate reductase n=1 Tax=Alkalibacillus almallahensis TaxID=1379154 RepID=UPI00141E7FDD|nr:dihydrofolate reductase [Alkalibacillus almallahensis]NIK11018.1 dihydrofolate reductase [Alkalibacillus almallahensis]